MAQQPGSSNLGDVCNVVNVRCEIRFVTAQKPIVNENTLRDIYTSLTSLTTKFVKANNESFNDGKDIMKELLEISKLGHPIVHGPTHTRRLDVGDIFLLTLVIGNTIKGPIGAGRYLTMRQDSMFTEPKIFGSVSGSTKVDDKLALVDGEIIITNIRKDVKSCEQFLELYPVIPVKPITAGIPRPVNPHFRSMMYTRMRDLPTSQ